MEGEVETRKAWPAFVFFGGGGAAKKNREEERRTSNIEREKSANFNIPKRGHRDKDYARCYDECIGFRRASGGGDRSYLHLRSHQAGA